MITLLYVHDAYLVRTLCLSPTYMIQSCTYMIIITYVHDTIMYVHDTFM